MLRQEALFTDTATHLRYTAYAGHPSGPSSAQSRPGYTQSEGQMATNGHSTDKVTREGVKSAAVGADKHVGDCTTEGTLRAHLPHEPLQWGLDKSYELLPPPPPLMLMVPQQLLQKRPPTSGRLLDCCGGCAWHGGSAPSLHHVKSDESNTPALIHLTSRMHLGRLGNSSLGSCCIGTTQTNCWE